MQHTATRGGWINRNGINTTKMEIHTGETLASGAIRIVYCAGFRGVLLPRTEKLLPKIDQDLQYLQIYRCFGILVFRIKRTKAGVAEETPM